MASVQLNDSYKLSSNQGIGYTDNSQLAVNQGAGAEYMPEAQPGLAVKIAGKFESKTSAYADKDIAVNTGTHPYVNDHAYANADTDIGIDIDTDAKVKSKGQAHAKVTSDFPSLSNDICSWGDMDWAADLMDAAYGTASNIANGDDGTNCADLEDIADLANISTARESAVQADKLRSVPKTQVVDKLDLVAGADYGNEGYYRVLNAAKVCSNRGVHGAHGILTSQISKMTKIAQGTYGSQYANGTQVSLTIRTKQELMRCIESGMDLSRCDISALDDLSYVFYKHNLPKARWQQIQRWDTRNVLNFSHMFEGSNLGSDIDLNAWDMRNARDLSYMFCDCPRFNTNLNFWQISRVKSLAHTFHNATNFNGDISQWDTHNVLTMESVLQGASKFNGDLRGWTVNQVINWQNAFEQTPHFFKLGTILNDWHFDAARCVNYMLAHTRTLMPERLYFPQALSLKGLFYESKNSVQSFKHLCAPKAVNLTWTFAKCKSLNPNLNVICPQAQHLDYMFAFIPSLILLDCNFWQLGTSVTSDRNVQANLTQGATSCVTSVFSSWVNSGLNAESNSGLKTLNEFDDKRGYAPESGHSSGFSYDAGLEHDVGCGAYPDGVSPLMPSVDPGSILGIGSGLEPNLKCERGATADTVSQLAYMTQVAQHNQQTQHAKHAQQTPQVQPARYVSMVGMFQGVKLLQANFKAWDVSNVANMACMFKNSGIIHGLSAWQPLNVTNMSEMFSGASKFSDDLGRWQVNKVLDFERMFFKARAFDCNLKRWHIQPQAKTRQMFKRSGISKVNLPVISPNNLNAPNSLDNLEHRDNTPNHKDKLPAMLKKEQVSKIQAKKAQKTPDATADLLANMLNLLHQSSQHHVQHFRQPLPQASLDTMEMNHPPATKPRNKKLKRDKHPQPKSAAWAHRL